MVEPWKTVHDIFAACAVSGLVRTAGARTRSATTKAKAAALRHGLDDDYDAAGGLRAHPCIAARRTQPMPAEDFCSVRRSRPAPCLAMSCALKLTIE